MLRSPVLPALCLLCAALACGEKLEPGTPDMPDATATPTASTTDPVSSTNANPNGQTTASNANTSTGTGTSGGNTTASGGNTTVGATANVCGTNSATIGYAATAAASIKTNCAKSGCHDTKSPVMTDFATSKSGFQNGGLGAINGGSMPLGASLSTNDKCILTTWASGNYLP